MVCSTLGNPVDSGSRDKSAPSMKKNQLVRILLIGFVAVALAAALLTVPLTFIGKNRFKASLEALVRESLGLELSVAGDIDLGFFPRFEFLIEDLRLKNPEFPQELASARSAVISVDIWEFADNRLRVNEITLRGLHVNHRVEADGSNIWLSPLLRDSFDGSAEKTERRREDTGEELAQREHLSIGRIVIEDSTIDFQDVTRGSNYSLRGVTLDILEANDNRAAFTAEGMATYATYSTAHADEILVPLNFGAELAFDSSAQQASILELRLGIAPMLATVTADMDWQDGSLNMRGTAQAARFDLNDFLSGLEPPVITEPEQLGTPISAAVTASPASFSFGFSFDKSGFTIPDFDATLGNATIDADLRRLGVTEFQDANLNYSVRASTLDLSFLDKQRVAFWQPLLLDLVASGEGNTTGSIDVEGITGATHNLGELQLFISTEGNVQNIELQPLSLLGGEIDGVLRLERPPGGEKLIELNASLRRLDLAALSALVMPEDFSASYPILPLASSFDGKLSADMALVAEGGDWGRIANSITGDITYDLSHNTVDISLVKQVFSSIAALSPAGGSTEAWPDRISFEQLSGFVIIASGIDAPHRLNLLMDNLEIEGSGTLNSASGDFDYRLAFTLLDNARVEPLRINDAHRGKPWPVNCVANLGAAASQFCSPDFASVRELFAAPSRSQAPN
ncbi:AsmA family protein [Gammaproteobacteria bacterium]|nr:AsmA family protein [Gammaproteobacteria bacterium]